MSMFNSEKSLCQRPGKSYLVAHWLFLELKASEDWTQAHTRLLCHPLAQRCVPLDTYALFLTGLECREGSKAPLLIILGSVSFPSTVTL